MIDLAEFAGLAKAQEDGVDVTILHPKTGADLGIKIRVAGPDSARQRNARSAVNNERLHAPRGTPFTVADIEANSLKVMVASIISWSGIVENGNTIEFSPTAATELLTKYPFIRDQVDAAVGDRAGFIKG